MIVAENRGHRPMPDSRGAQLRPADLKNLNHRISPAIKARFRRNGWLGPWPDRARHGVPSAREAGEEETSGITSSQPKRYEHPSLRPRHFRDRLAVADCAFHPVGRLVLFRQGGGAGNPAADAGARPRADRRRGDRDPDPAARRSVSARPGHLEDVRRAGGAQQRHSVHADLLGAALHPDRARLDPQRDQPAVQRAWWRIRSRTTTG